MTAAHSPSSLPMDSHAWAAFNALRALFLAKPDRVRGVMCLQSYRWFLEESLEPATTREANIARLMKNMAQTLGTEGAIILSEEHLATLDQPVSARGRSPGRIKLHPFAVIPPGLPAAVLADGGPIIPQHSFQQSKAS